MNIPIFFYKLVKPKYILFGVYFVLSNTALGTPGVDGFTYTVDGNSEQYLVEFDGTAEPGSPGHRPEMFGIWPAEHPLKLDDSLQHAIRFDPTSTEWGLSTSANLYVPVRDLKGGKNVESLSVGGAELFATSFRTRRGTKRLQDVHAAYLGPDGYGETTPYEDAVPFSVHGFSSLRDALSVLPNDSTVTNNMRRIVEAAENQGFDDPVKVLVVERGSGGTVIPDEQGRSLVTDVHIIGAGSLVFPTNEYGKNTALVDGDVANVHSGNAKTHHVNDSIAAKAATLDRATPIVSGIMEAPHSKHEAVLTLTPGPLLQVGHIKSHRREP